MSKEEIVTEFHTWLSDNSFTPERDRLNKIKDAFNAQKALSREKQMEAHTSDGGDEGDFEYNPDALDNRFEELLGIYHDKRKKAEQAREDEENSNLSEKKALIDELHGLIQDEENIGKAYKRFNAIKQKWNETGPVPRAKRRDLQSDYSRLIELFYYNINIYRELQIHDLKKNQELKEELIDKIKLIKDEKSINQVDFLIHQYLDEWDEIGPTFREEWDRIREEFRTEVGKVFDRIRDHRKAVKEDHQQNYERKEALIEQVKEIASKEFNDVTEVQKMTKAVIDIQKQWKKIGYAGKSKNDTIWADFRGACDNYFGQRDKFMEESNVEFKQVRDAKRALIDRAKEIYESEDFVQVSNELKGLQRQWKQAGKLLPHEEYKFFKEFRKYCDVFFKRKKAASERVMKEAKENLAKKEALLDDIKMAIDKGIKDKGEELINDWRQQWSDLGDVPHKMQGKLEKGFEGALEKAYKSLGISQAQVEEKKFESKLEVLSSANNADHALAREKSQLIQKIKETQTTLAQEESKLDFFKYSDDSNPLKKELMTRIQGVKDQLAELKERKKRIDLTIKGLNQESQSEQKEDGLQEQEQGEDSANSREEGN